MSNHHLALLIGGLIPALLFGSAGIFQKICAQQGISSGLFLICVGLGNLIVGAAALMIQGYDDVTLKQCIPGLAMGMSLGVGTLLVVYAIAQYQVPISKLAPLYNMNTLVTVIAGLLIFSEWKTVNGSSVIIGSILIILGGIVVSS